MPLLSVIIPVYNEAGSIKQILEKINTVNIDKEIIIIDDGSTDGTARILREIKLPNLKMIHHTTNRGKGAAVLTGINNAEGEFVIIQDADLEYEPQDYLKLMEARQELNADIVLGARFTKGYHGAFIPRIGNRTITGLLNLLFGTRLNDCFSCYKLFRRQTMKDFDLHAQSFNIEIEIITKAIQNKLRIIEVPIAYQPRTYSEGKKIRWRDGVEAILSLIKYRFSQKCLKLK